MQFITAHTRRTGEQVELRQRSEVTIITVIHPLGSNNIITVSLEDA